MIEIIILLGNIMSNAMAKVVSGNSIMAMVNEFYPNYHPLLSIAHLAHHPDMDLKGQLDCHKTIAKYVATELRAVDVRQTVTDSRRVVVSLFDAVTEVVDAVEVLEYDGSNGV